jgi:hypothetical protein
MSTESLGANECCEGIASVRVSRFFPTDDFPTEDPRSLVSGGPLTYAVELELEVVRCGVQPGENFTPTDAQLTADAQWQLDDAAAMRRVAVHLIAQDSVRNAVIGTYDPGSADGGCLGGKLTLTVQVDCLES